MKKITSKEEATKYAVNYLKQKGYDYAKCLFAVKLPRRINQLWAGLIEGECNLETDIWQVSFLYKDLEPDVISTANEFSVFVESENGNCGIFFNM